MFKGFDVVFGRRIDRKDTAITKFLSRSFYKVYDYFTEGNFDSTICNFSISKRKVINYYIQMREQNRAYIILDVDGYLYLQRKNDGRSPR
mgnify:CR=1 FL=1